MAIKQTAGRTQLGDFMPKFAQLNDDVLFGEVWSREDKLSPKHRSMITIACLIGKGITGDALEAHLKMGKANGITKTEISEMLTQLGFYAGWPNIWGMAKVAEKVYSDDSIPEKHGGFFGQGDFNSGFAKYFTGNSYLNPVSKPGDYLNISNVTFEPGCRNFWHIHHASKGGGQVLICVDGNGWYQEEGKPAQALHPGDVVEIPANVKHWHGAAKDSWFSHLAFSYPGEDASTEWLEEVTDQEYNAL